MSFLSVPGRVGRVGQGRLRGSAQALLSGIFIAGQSLGLGSDPNGSSVITTQPVTGHFMFNGGIRPVYDRPGETNVNTTIYPSQITSLATLQSAMSAVDPVELGETFAPGMALRMTSPGIFAATGRGAFPLASLNRTSANHFANTVTAAMAGRDLATEAGYGYRVGAVLWKHGEADAAAGTSKATYKAGLRTLRQDLENHFDFAALGDIGTLKMLIDQQAMSASTGTWADIAVGAIELHREGGGFFCAGPTYWCTFTAANDVHMSEVTYRVYGEKLGIITQRLLDNLGWNPCHITAVSRVGSTIFVTVHVPYPPLVFDTTNIAAVANRGFTYSGATITDVSITNDGVGTNTATIAITLNSAVGGTLGVAYNNYAADGYIGPTFGSRTNIRDSDPAVSLYNGAPLYNWLCNDQWVVT